MTQSMAEETPLRQFGPWTGSMLIIASMIGTGVFTTTGFMIADIKSLPAVLICWFLGGVLALAGALSYAELAAAMPENGGEFLYLSRIYHPAVGFVAGSTSLVVGFAAPVAASAIAFSYYLGAIFPAAPKQTIAILLIMVLSALHACRVSIGSQFQNALTVGKVLLIVAFIAAGLWTGDPGRIFSDSPGDVAEAVLSPLFAVGLIFVSFAYSGWNACIYISGEIKQPERNIPISLFLGTAVVTLLYLGLNIVFLSAAPAEQLAGVAEVGHVAAVGLFGDRAARFFSAIIAIGLISTIGAYIMTGPRVYEAMGRAYPRLHLFTGRGKDRGPVAAIILQAVVAIAMVSTASLRALLTYVGLSLSVFVALAVAGVIILRLREPDLARPYRVWGYPVTPIVFVLLVCWMIVNTIFERPVEALAGLLTLVTGLILYLVLGRTV
jgi:APA family basic amino acid/polyamine antiporter